jgi:manganese/zinc/iron transport system substrate-binding protein
MIQISIYKRFLLNLDSSKMYNMRKSALIVCVLCVLYANSCSTDGKRSKLVVATTGMLADMSRALLPEEIQVEGLMGPGVDPHLYKARQRDLSLFRQADLIVFNGLHLEGKLSEILLNMEGRTYAAAEKLPKDSLLFDLETGTVPDPHVWHDVVLWQQVCDSLAATLKQRFPAHAEQIAQRHAAYSAEMDSLHRFMKQTLSIIPVENRVLVTAHDAFSYFGRRYAIEIHALQGISTVAEFGLKDVTELVDFITARKIPSIFVESSISPRSIESVMAGCAERGHKVALGGVLYSDALGGTGSGADSYSGMLKANAAVIAGGLNAATRKGN